MSHVRIVMTDHGRGQVFIDGHEVLGVRSVFFDASADSTRLNSLLLTLSAQTVEIDGPAEVDPLRDLLALAHQYADECAECGGSGTTWTNPRDPQEATEVPCEQCADIRAVIAKAEPQQGALL